MKFIKILFSVLISSSLYSQTIIGNKVEAKSQLRVAGYNITGITNDTNLSSGSIMKLPTEKEKLINFKPLMKMVRYGY